MSLVESAKKFLVGDCYILRAFSFFFCLNRRKSQIDDVCFNLTRSVYSNVGVKSKLLVSNPTVHDFRFKMASSP